jgi:hypothetical protein
MKWWDILKIEPKDNPLSDDFEPPKIPPIDRIKLHPKLISSSYSNIKPRRLLDNFPIAKKLFEIRKSDYDNNILRIENDYWIYDNSYFALAFNTQFDESIIKEHDLKSTVGDIDLFLDAILEFFLTIDSNYQKRTEAIKTYATAIYNFIVIEYAGSTSEKSVIEGTVDEAMRILESFEGKVQPIEIVIQETIDDIKEGNTEIDWETLSELYITDIDTYYDHLYNLQDDEGARGIFMNPEDYVELRTEEELRRRRNRG